jgi:hypothetical protein
MRKEAAEAAMKSEEKSGETQMDPAADEDEAADETGRMATPREIADLLADPLRKTRERYLPPGRYTVEIAAGTEKATTRLDVKAPKKEAAGEEED